MSNWPNIFATLPAGNQPAAKIDENFAAAAYYPDVSLQAGLNYTYQNTDSNHTIVRTNAAAMGDTLPTATGTGGNFPSGFQINIKAQGNAVTLTPASGTVDGAANATITVGSSAVATTDGTNWFTMPGTGASASIPNVINNPQTGAYTVIGTDKGKLVDATANTWTLNITASATLGSGFWCYLRNSGAGEITLEPFGAETIDGLTNYILYPNEIRLLQCNGSSLRTLLLEPGFQIYTANGTFTKPPGASMFAVFGRAAGGGGGGGRGGSAGTERNGGAGGGGGCGGFVFIAAGNLAATESVAIGAGGTSGAGGSAANGADGGQGGNTTFGTTATWLTVYGGGGGAGGDNTSGAAGGGGGGSGSKGGSGVTVTPGTGGGIGYNNNTSGADTLTHFISFYVGGDGSAPGGVTTNNGIAKYMGGSGGAGGHSGGGAGSAGSQSMYGGGSGGSGGGVTTGNAESVGGAGGKTGGLSTAGGGAAGAVNGGVGGAGALGTNYNGSGGGGGGSQDSGTAGAGGVGGAGGGGGGGGGAGTTIGGAGGVGGAGSLLIWWW